ncbi:MAG: PfkB family carbohydrate kinase, partial [Pseudomonadota bacterium]
LESGRRIGGRSDLGAYGDLLGGRLGGGAANASAALQSAGHSVSVFSAVSEDTIGDRILEHAASLDIDLSLVRRVPQPRGVSLILVEPNGERTILGVSDLRDDVRSTWRKALQKCAPLTVDDLHNIAPNGIYLRAAYPGYAVAAHHASATIVAHWPFAGFDTPVSADVLIGSADDLSVIAEREDLFGQAQQVAGARLRALIVTDGAQGGAVYSPNTQFTYKSPNIAQKDATGAGDIFAAGLLEALVLGADLREAVEHGARWGAIAASEAGPLSAYAPGRFTAWTEM